MPKTLQTFKRQIVFQKAGPLKYIYILKYVSAMSAEDIMNELKWSIIYNENKRAERDL